MADATQKEFLAHIAKNPHYQTGGHIDEDGFYQQPDGSFFDSEGYYFNKAGYDEFGGYYDDNGEYCEPQDEIENEGKTEDLIDIDVPEEEFKEEPPAYDPTKAPPGSIFEAILANVYHRATKAKIETELKQFGIEYKNLELVKDKEGKIMHVKLVIEKVDSAKKLNDMNEKIFLKRPLHVNMKDYLESATKPVEEKKPEEEKKVVPPVAPPKTIPKAIENAKDNDNFMFKLHNVDQKFQKPEVSDQLAKEGINFGRLGAFVDEKTNETLYWQVLITDKKSAIKFHELSGKPILGSELKVEFVKISTPAASTKPKVKKP